MIFKSIVLVSNKCTILGQPENSATFETFENQKVIYLTNLAYSLLFPRARQMLQSEQYSHAGETMRQTLTIASLLMFSVSCAKVSKNTASTPDSLPSAETNAPKIARCSQVSEVEKLQIRETIFVQIQGDSLSGTYHYATGDRSSLTDTGFQHLAGKIAKSNLADGSKITVTLGNGTLSTYFDEDFAASKELAELTYDLKEKKVSFALGKDERVTTIGSCQFE
ncbi:MAG: hypothetical protein RL189_142 [Pseudomonadota bacterium]|jgi:hypothetical protein